MHKKLLNPGELFDPRYFTHTVSLSGPARLVYVAGQVSYARDGSVVGRGDMAAQTRQVFENLAHNLRAAGARWSDVVKVNGYMVGMNPQAVTAYREVRSQYLDPKNLPASTLVGVERLVHDDLLLEVEVIAAVAERRPAAPRAAKKPRSRRKPRR